MRFKNFSIALLTALSTFVFATSLQAQTRNEGRAAQEFKRNGRLQNRLMCPAPFPTLPIIK